VDLRHNLAREVHPGDHNTLSGIDGLYWTRNGLVGVQAVGTFRVARWFLSTDGLRVIGADILEKGTSLLRSPTTGAIRGNRFYFIANTGIDNYDDGKILNPEKLEAVHIAVVPLR
jgi:hypothetical protein